jgi:hypothetical protein
MAVLVFVALFGVVLGVGLIAPAMPCVLHGVELLHLFYLNLSRSISLDEQVLPDELGVGHDQGQLVV